MIEILNENFLKIDILRKYTFAQYTNKFREVGTFKINARLVEENLYLLAKQDMYVLFDGRILGKIEDVKKESDSEFEQTIELSGRLANVLFTKRVVAGTIKFKGNTAQLIKSVIENEITKDKNSNRYIDIVIKYDNESYLNSICSKVEKEITGGYIWDSIQQVMEQDSLGIYFLPIVSTKHKNSEGLDTNISSWELYISAGKNRTKQNRKNETPVVFSQSLSNIARTDYEYNTESYCNVAYVAGEGEGTERKWYEIKRTSEEEKGWKRNELWVDARDIQSVDEEGNEITKQEYDELIKQRSSEKFTEASKEESYEATITEANKQYTYGTDYVLGDFVTIVDNELEIEIDAQITEVTRTIEGVREIVDIAFTYGKVNRDPVEQIKVVENITDKNINDIKYLEATLNKQMSYPIKAITIGYDTSGDLEIGSGEKYIYLQSILNNTAGKLLTFSNGCVKIGAGVKKVLVSFNVFTWCDGNDDTYSWYRLELWRNNQKYKELPASIVPTSTEFAVERWGSVVCSPFLVDVQENDEFWLYKITKSNQWIRKLDSFVTIQVAGM